MESSQSSSSSLERLVSEVRNEIILNYSDADHVSPSAYDTAWLAMIPHEETENGPMFDTCLKWILLNQKEGGFWGESDDDDLPTIDALTATLACAIALKLWNTGHRNIQSGLSFIYSKAEILVKINYRKLPRWFVLTFPAMIEMAEAAGLRLRFPPGLIGVIDHIFIRRHHILQTEEVVEGEESCRYFPPLLSHLETLPSTYELDREETVRRYLSADGSLFQSPSATAQAFISTGNIHSLKYLRSLLLNFPNGGVPAKYPVDKDLIKLCMVDHVQGLGLGAHFNQEIEQILAQLYSNQKIIEKSNASVTDTVPMKLFKDSLAFRLLRMRRYNVHPGSFCWFLQEPETVSYMEENSQEFVSAMYNVYRATDLAFPGETQMEEARKFSRKFLQNPNNGHISDHNLLITKGLQNLMKYEVDVPWYARLDRLYHRKWIEENKSSPLWTGKASYYRLGCLENKKLMQLAVEKFEFEQWIYIQELQELRGWSKKWRLSEMGFGREKTVYSYFSVASACSGFAYSSIMRLLIAKAAIIVTVADDFYDMEGSLPDLEILTDAVMRWDGEGLGGHSKTIFEALDDYVNEIVAKCYPQQETRVMPMLQDLWRECFTSWMVERRWSESGHVASMDEYLEMGMASIAAHAIALPATAFFFNQNGSAAAPGQYQNITRLLMLITRLANDMQSYQKEVADGKMNLVVLRWHREGKGSIEESVAHVKQILEEKRKEFLQHVFQMGEDEEEMTESCKQIHLCCMKVFEMFFNSANLFDSETALLQDIQNSLYLPIHPEHRIVPLPKSNNSNMTTTIDKSTVSARFSTLPSTNYFPGKLQVLPNPMRCNLRFIALPL